MGRVVKDWTILLSVTFICAVIFMSGFVVGLFSERVRTGYELQRIWDAAEAAGCLVEEEQLHGSH